MRKTLLTALGAAALLSAGAFANQASAMTAATPSAIGAAAGSGLVEKAAVVCGYNGCVRVVPGYYGYYRPYGWYGRPYGWYGRRWYY